MAFNLPVQEDQVGTYLQDIPYMSKLIKNRLVPGSPEGETSRVWDDILHHCFPAAEGYSTGPEMLMGDGRPDLFTAHIVLEPRFNEKKFLIVECKASGLESQDAIWKEGADQLERYLRSIRGPHPKFGAIAIGKCVRFYEWNNGLTNMSNGDILYIDRQCKSVTEHLVHFRENH